MPSKPPWRNSQGATKSHVSWGEAVVGPVEGRAEIRLLPLRFGVPEAVCEGDGQRGVDHRGRHSAMLMVGVNDDLAQVDRVVE